MIGVMISIDDIPEGCKLVADSTFLYSLNVVEKATGKEIGWIRVCEAGFADTFEWQEAQKDPDKVYEVVNLGQEVLFTGLHSECNKFIRDGKLFSCWIVPQSLT